ncbi:MAG: hypothetical protein MJ184_10900 [Treponema sp.]|uniref:hypothetical protein n=1 Tax=Treponema sp. TaxID=166 RepID=UPI00298EC7F0|nr:hypothetical protein [Treponema sp.]MCQ2601856.1 hypothetical protein [Treponema sp.]
MKKIAALILSLFVAGTVYAKGAYSGDVQIRSGFGIGGLVFRQGDYETGTPVGEFDFGLTTTHLFDLNSVLSLGFTFQFDCGIGASDIYNKKLSTGESKTERMGAAATVGMLLGPTFAVTCGEVVRFSGTLGFSFNAVSTINDSDFAYIGAAPGVGFDINAKFVPNKNVSPVIGYNMCFGFTDRVYNADGAYNVTTDGFVTTITGAFYAGISWNW